MRDIDSLAGDPRFKDAVWEILELHAKKQADYGTDGDPFANVRASEEFGVPAWVGVAIRLNDKVTRLKSMALKGKLENESIEDSFNDISVYGQIGKILWREAQVAQPVERIHYAHLPTEDCGVDMCPFRKGLL